MGVLLDVRPAGYSAASRVLGEDMAGTVLAAANCLTAALRDLGEMAGSDPAGTTWARAYDAAASAAVGATQDVINGCYQLAGLLEQSGFNYGLAENSSGVGGLDRTAADTNAYAYRSVYLGSVTSASGGSRSQPVGWSLISHVVGAVWPDGHQNRLRQAAGAWSDAAREIDRASWSVSNAVEAISAQVAPEVDDALTACAGMRAHLEELADTQRALAGACADFADHIDTAHSQIEHELLSLVEWTAGIQIGGAVLGFFTAGLAEAPAQGLQASRAIATAGKVGTLIAHLDGFAAAAAEVVSTAAARVARVSRDLKGLLASEVSIAAVESVGDLPAALRTTEQVAEETAIIRLGAAPDLRVVPAQRWGDAKALERHFAKHGHDFGARSPDEYARQATEFFEKGLLERLPMKISADGTVRIYDPASNTFGSYGPAGITRTFFKPAGVTYWDRQPGVMQ